MPSPSSQNLRSAPQKQQRPNTACARPAGYGGCSWRPLTKWLVAVGIGLVRPDNASAALGKAVVLRMNNMDYLPERCLFSLMPVTIYAFTSAAVTPLRRAVGHKRRTTVPSGSVPRIADQRLARPEQEHQQNAQHAHHGKYRLIQHDPDDMGPEPRRNALHPDPQGLLAGLMDIVPEFAKPGKAQGLIGDPARPVIDHEDESAGQQQQSDKSEKAADHASP